MTSQNLLQSKYFYLCFKKKQANKKSNKHILPDLDKCLTVKLRMSQTVKWFCLKIWPLEEPKEEAGAKSAVRLVELGPRIRMHLLKIEEGVAEGEVLYHQFIVKTEEEKKIIRVRREHRRLVFFVFTWKVFT